MNGPSPTEWPSLPASAMPKPVANSQYQSASYKALGDTIQPSSLDGPRPVPVMIGRPIPMGHNRVMFTSLPQQQAYQMASGWQQQQQQQQQQPGAWVLTPPPRPPVLPPTPHAMAAPARSVQTGMPPPGLEHYRPRPGNRPQMAAPRPHEASPVPLGLVQRSASGWPVGPQIPPSMSGGSASIGQEANLDSGNGSGRAHGHDLAIANSTAMRSNSSSNGHQSILSDSSSLGQQSPDLTETPSSPPTTLRKSLSQERVANEDQLLTPGLDRYAPVYTPSWLQQVNEDRLFTLHPLPERLPIDFQAYSSEFLPPSLYWSEADEDEEMKIDDEEAALAEDPPLEKADSSWLASGKDDAAEQALEGELEPEGPLVDEAPANDTAHASVGAVSQQAHGDGEPLLSAGLASTAQQVAELSSPSEPIPPLEAETYAERFDILERLEVDHRGRELAKQTLFSVKLRVYHPPGNAHGDSPWSSSNLYILDLPGVREDYPALMPGDLMQLRTLASQSDSWLKVAFEARVHVVRRVEGAVILRCDALARELRTLFPSVEQARFNVLFMSLQRNTTEVVQDVARLGKLLKRKSKPANILKHWIFPTAHHLETEREGVGWKREDLDWVDSSLNAEQKGAVFDIAMRSHRIPYLVAGPPGTGKTKTLVEATLQIVRNDKDATVLLAAPSNTAADTLALRLAAHFGPGQMVRLNDPTRTFAEVPERLLLFCCIEEQKDGEDDSAAAFGLPPWKKLMGMRVVVMATHDVPLLHRTRGASNIDLGRLYNCVVSSFRQGGIAPRPRNHWTHLIIDEAGQATEADLSSALLCVVPSPFIDKALPPPTVVLCGDCNQLGAQIQSNAARNAGLDVSLLERLSERSVYKDELKRLRKQGREALMAGNFGPGVDGIVGRVVDGGNSTAAHLVRNYRARNPALLHVVSNLFYDDALLPCGPLPTLQTSSWPLLPNKDCPLLFDNVEGQDAWVDEGASFYNNMEVDRVVELVESLTGRSSTTTGDKKGTRIVGAKDIAVITPYREQVWRIRLALRKRELAAVNVGHVEVFQGAEHLVTILSTVRTSARFLRVDAARSMGLLFERKRLCVAISRAKELLIVVGNATLLMRDPYWRSLLEHAVRTNTFRGQPPEKLGIQAGSDEVNGGGQISALEYAARANDPSSAAGDTALLAGRMAASTLLEDD